MSAVDDAVAKLKASSPTPAPLVPLVPGTAPVFQPAAQMSNELVPDDKKYYHCSVVAGTMLRHDGQKIIFIHGIYGTNNRGDIQYLDSEIEAGHPYLSKATTEQTHQYRMMTDIRGTVREEVLAEINKEERARIRAEIETEVNAKFNTLVAGLQTADGSEVNLAGVDLASRLASLTTVRSGGGVVKLGGIQSSEAIKAAAAGSGT